MSKLLNNNNKLIIGVRNYPLSMTGLFEKLDILEKEVQRFFSTYVTHN